MAHEYTSLALLKRSLGGITDTARDDLLQGALEAASRQVDNTCSTDLSRRRFWLDPVAVERTYRLTDRVFCEPDGDRIEVGDIGDVTGLAVAHGSALLGWTDITASIETQPDNAIADGRAVTSLLYVGGRLPTTAALRVRVTARWGWPILPPEVSRATLIQAARLWKRQDSPEGVLGSSEWGVVRTSKVDPDVRELLREYTPITGFA